MVKIPCVGCSTLVDTTSIVCSACGTAIGHNSEKIDAEVVLTDRQKARLILDRFHQLNQGSKSANASGDRATLSLYLFFLQGPYVAEVRDWKRLFTEYKTVTRLTAIDKDEAFSRLERRQQVVVETKREVWDINMDDPPAWVQLGKKESICSFRDLLSYARRHRQLLTEPYLRWPEGGWFSRSYGGLAGLKEDDPWIPVDSQLNVWPEAAAIFAGEAPP